MIIRIVSLLMLVGALALLLACSDGADLPPGVEQRDAGSEVSDVSPGADTPEVRVFTAPEENGPVGECEFHWDDASGLHADAYWVNFPFENEFGERVGFAYSWMLVDGNGTEEVAGEADEVDRTATLILAERGEPAGLSFEVTPLYDEETPGESLSFECDVRRVG